MSEEENEAAGSAENNSKKSMFERYCEIYGPPPKVIEVFKDPVELWGFQEDIIKFATSDQSNVQTPHEIYKAMNGSNIIVHPDEDEYLKENESAERCTIVQSKSTGQREYHLYLGTERYYREVYGLSSSLARSFRLNTLAHAGGHASDHIQYTDISLWGSEIRQQFFSRQFALAVGDNDLLDETRDFFDAIREKGITYKW